MSIGWAFSLCTKRLIALNSFHYFHTCLYLQELSYIPSLPPLGKWYPHKAALVSDTTQANIHGGFDAKHQYLRIVLHIN